MFGLQSFIWLNWIPNQILRVWCMHFKQCTSHYALHTQHFTWCTLQYALQTIHLALCIWQSAFDNTFYFILEIFSNQNRKMFIFSVKSSFTPFRKKTLSGTFWGPISCYRTQPALFKLNVRTIKNECVKLCPSSGAWKSHKIRCFNIVDQFSLPLPEILSDQWVAPVWQRKFREKGKKSSFWLGKLNSCYDKSKPSGWLL